MIVIVDRAAIIGTNANDCLLNAPPSNANKLRVHAALVDPDIHHRLRGRSGDKHPRATSVLHYSLPTVHLPEVHLALVPCRESDGKIMSAGATTPFLPDHSI